MKTKQQQKDEAYVAFRAIRDPALKVYEVIAGSAWEAYKAITDPALKVYEAKCREIDEQVDEDIKIIDGKRYKLIKE